jgi:hypothetical protein
MGHLNFLVKQLGYSFIPYSELIMHNAVLSPTSVTGLIKCEEVLLIKNIQVKPLPYALVVWGSQLSG